MDKEYSSFKHANLTNITYNKHGKLYDVLSGLLVMHVMCNNMHSSMLCVGQTVETDDRK